MSADIMTEALTYLKRIEAKLDQLAKGDAPTFDPDIRIDPAPFKDRPGWTGPTMVGKKFSEAPSEWLDMAAAMYEGFAAKAKKDGSLTSNGGSKEEWNLKLASAARKWSKFNRGNAPTLTAVKDKEEEGESPF